jgi:hypothetical protein
MESSPHEPVPDERSDEAGRLAESELLVRSINGRRSMVSKLRMHNVVVSLDGFVTGEGQSLDSALAHAQQAFMKWFGKIRIRIVKALTGRVLQCGRSMMNAVP